MTVRGKRRVVTGFVISDKMQKTITVKVERLVKHPVVKKHIKRYSICKAHDEKEEAGNGDLVEIMQTRPISKTKRWRLAKIIKKQETENVTGKEQA